MSTRFSSFVTDSCIDMAKRLPKKHDAMSMLEVEALIHERIVIFYLLAKLIFLFQNQFCSRMCIYTSILGEDSGPVRRYVMG